MEIRQTAAFRDWFDNLRDRDGKARIARRIAALALGRFGDAKPVGDGTSELRLHFGPGYRLYLTRRGDTLVLLLLGGDKDSQARDIARAKALAAETGD